MRTWFFEASQDVEGGAGPANWGKFMVGRFTDDEWRVRSQEIGRGQPLVSAVCGWSPGHLLVLDLQTGEGAIMRPGGSAPADLRKHRIWVCPMFEPFLEWLWDRLRGVSEFGLTPALTMLAGTVELPDAPFEWAGHRREGTGA